MKLNLPIYERVADCKNLLIAGMGGGFDIYCGLPIYFELKARGQNVHLANYSFSDFEYMKQVITLTDSLIGVTATTESYNPYDPERHLAVWLKQTRNEDTTIWCFEKTGALELLKNYRALINHLQIDGIILIDGGVDSLMHGDEAELGTIVEDTVSLAAVAELHNVPVRLTVSVGMGAEQDISYPHVFENIAELAAAEAFLGACSLAKCFESYRAYEELVLFAQSQPYQDPSVINSSIVSAVQGNHGDYHLTSKTRGSRLSISPLMAIYWFFELMPVAERNFFCSQVRHTSTFRDAYLSVVQVRNLLNKRKPTGNALG